MCAGAQAQIRAAREAGAEQSGTDGQGVNGFDAMYRTPMRTDNI